MASKSEKLPQEKQVLLSERSVFLLALGGAFLLAVLAYITPLRAIFHSEYGMFSNAAALFYLVAFGYGLKGITAINLENWKRWRPLAVLSMLALFMAGEELNWGLSFVLEADQRWPVESLRDLIALSLLGVPEAADITLIGFIAAVRWVLLLALVYGVGAGLYYHERLKEAWERYSGQEAFFYGRAFVGFLFVGILMKAGLLPGRDVFGECLNMAAALAFLMTSLQFLGKVFKG